MYTRCGACRYKWTWAGKDACFRCEKKFAVPASAAPAAAGGAWAHGRTGAAVQASKRAAEPPRKDDGRVKTAVEAASEALAACKSIPGPIGDRLRDEAQAALESLRKEREDGKSLSVKRINATAALNKAERRMLDAAGEVEAAERGLEQAAARAREAKFRHEEAEAALQQARAEAAKAAQGEADGKADGQTFPPEYLDAEGDSAAVVSLKANMRSSHVQLAAALQAQAQAAPSPAAAAPAPPTPQSARKCSIRSISCQRDHYSR